MNRLLLGLSLLWITQCWGCSDPPDVTPYCALDRTIADPLIRSSEEKSGLQVGVRFDVEATQSVTTVNAPLMNTHDNVALEGYPVDIAYPNTVARIAGTPVRDNVPEPEKVLGPSSYKVVPIDFDNEAAHFDERRAYLERLFVQ